MSETNLKDRSDLAIAYKVLSTKKAVYDILWNYYDGVHDLKYSTDRLQEVFGTKFAKFVENWCAVVVDAVWERLILKGFEVGTSAEAKTRLESAWKETQMDLDSSDAHLAALVTGEAFVIAWPDEKGNPQAYYNDPRLVHVKYDAENPREKKWGAKWWVADDTRYHLNLYYKDRIEYYLTAPMNQAPSAFTAFKPAPEIPFVINEFEKIPIFHFRRIRRAISSELTTSILSLQDAIDKLLTDLMVTGEFGAFPQRYVISNSDLGELKNAPNEIWEIPSGDGVGQAASVGQLAAAALSNYISAIEHMVKGVASISRTPRHFFFGSQGQLSGEALIALEAPLNKKCLRYMETFGDTWQRCAAFLLEMSGIQVSPEDITPIWVPPETVQPKTQSEIRKISVDSGIPLTTILRSEGWSDAELAQLQKDKAEEKMAGSASLAKALLEQQRDFDQEDASDAAGSATPENE